MVAKFIKDQDDLLFRMIKNKEIDPLDAIMMKSDMMALNSLIWIEVLVLNLIVVYKTLKIKQGELEMKGKSFGWKS